jgi:cholesterol oxidase
MDERLDRRTFLSLVGATALAAASGCATGEAAPPASQDVARAPTTTDRGAVTRIDSFPPFFGERRELAFPPLERSRFAALDGAELQLHHTSGGERGPVILAPGTAMTGLSFAIDSVPQNLVEFLVAEGFDVWLFDWRTSPLLAAHARPYTMEDVARFDWPAVVAEVQRRTGKKQVTVLAHCLSSPCLMLSLVRGYMPRDQVRGFVASAVGLDLVMTQVGMLKVETHVEKAMPPGEMVHQKPSESVHTVSDLAVSVLARIVPKSYSCDNPACYRHSATFGDLILHERVDPTTHAMMGDLVPEVVCGFLHDVAIHSRRQTVLEEEDLAHLDRLALPIQLVSGSENRMFVPESTERSYQRLVEANGAGSCTRKLYPGFGHLDCYIGRGADEEIWPGFLSVLA